MSSPKYKVLDLGFTALFTLLVVFLTMCVMRDDERVFRNLHVHETGGATGEFLPPNTYFALDWLVHPLTRHAYGSRAESEKYHMHMAMNKDDCYSSGMSWDNGDCGPALWQKADFCPDKNGHAFESGLTMQVQNGGVVNPASVVDIISHMYDRSAEGKNSLQRSDIINPVTSHIESAYWWRNSNMADVCRIERIPQMSTFLNDDTTWSIAASHSISVLLWGASVVMWVANFGDLVSNSRYRDKFTTIANMKYVMLLAPLVVLAFLRWTSSTESMEAGVETFRLLPNGSYFYVLLLMVMGAYTIINIKSIDEDLVEDNMNVKEGERNRLITPAQATEIPGDPVGEQAQFSMNVSGFIKPRTTQTLDAYMTRTAAMNSTRMYSKFDASKVLTQTDFGGEWDVSAGYFGTAQLYALPLLTMGVFMSGTNYEVDSILQQIFMATVLYGLVDVAVYRLRQIMLVTTRLLGGVVENVITRTIAFVGVVFQIFIFLFIFMIMRWNLSFGSRKSVPVTGGKSMQAHVDNYAAWTYVVYFTLSLVVKITALVASNDVQSEDRSTTSHTLFSALHSINSNRRSILFFLLNVFCGVLLTMLTLDLVSVRYRKGLPMPTDIPSQAAVTAVYREYRSGWQSHARS